jgi:phosphate transport system protein
MVLEFFRGGADSQLEEIEGLIIQMLLDSRHTFDLAINALIGGTDPDTVGAQIRKTDIGVNRALRQVRKELVVHASVRGAKADLPMLLTSMSIVKDAERIGDYAKNIWDVASAGMNLSEAPDIAQLMAIRDRTSAMIGEAARVFRENDVDAAHRMIQDADGIQDEYDAGVYELLSSPGSVATSEGVARALLYRYLKRITAHAMNVLTSLVMPVHRLDFYDEKKSDRA